MNMRKNVILTMCLLLLVFCLVGCSGNSSLSEIIICVIPFSSLKSMNFILPRSLIVATQPARRTSSPTFFIFNVFINIITSICV